jgi:acyl dehydratase
VGLAVAERRETSKPDRGVITFTAKVTNQRGELAGEGELVELVRRREAGGS